MTVIEYRRNPVKAILKACPVCPFRMGTNPYRTKREMTEEQRIAAAKRLAAARAERE